MKNKFMKILQESKYSDYKIDYAGDCIPTVEGKAFLSGGVVISNDIILIITRKNIYKYAMVENISGIRVENKILEKSLILTENLNGNDIKLNFANDNEKEVFFDVFKENFERLKENFDKNLENLENIEGIQDLEEPTTENQIPYEELKKLKELLDLEIITQEEFDIKKKELLNLKGRGLGDS